MTVKRLFFALVSLTLIFSFLVSCADCQNDGECCDSSNEEPTLEKNGYETFFPTEPRDDVSEETIANFNAQVKNSEKYTDYRSIMPEEYREKYGVEIFTTSNASNTNVIFLSYNNKIHQIEAHGSDIEGNIFQGINHMALTDVDRDGSIELGIIYTSHIENHGRSVTSSLTFLDSKTNNTRKADYGSIPEKYLYFKPCESGKLGVFASDTNDAKSANEFYCEIENNTVYFTLTSTEYELLEDNLLSVKIKLNYDTLNFPICFSEIYHSLSYTTEMVYLGEEFSVTSQSSIHGATIKFISEDEQSSSSDLQEALRGAGLGVEPSVFTVSNGFTRVQTFGISYNLKDPPAFGTYNMIVKFQHIEISVPNALIISEKK